MNNFERAYLSIITESNNSKGDNPLTFTAEEANSTIKLSKYGSSAIRSLQYRLNKSDEWIHYKIGTVIELKNAGDYVQFQNTKNKLSTSSIDYVYFVMSGKIAASGNIQSMLNYSNSCKDYCYYRIFKDCPELTEAPELLATDLAKYCYNSMFDGCINLTKAPELPVTDLAENCYSFMFWNCPSLTKAPELPATNLAEYCYSYMFANCSSLTKAPELPATNLAEGCYESMFESCKSLTKAPELPATNLANYCYNGMFSGCTSLVEAPELPAANLDLAYSCYKNMFSGCTSLKEIPKAIENYND